MIDRKAVELVRNLLKILQAINDFENDFVLKGGTAINLFYSDMPRLSVDIDLTYNRINSRKETMNAFKTFFEKLDSRLKKNHHYKMNVSVTEEGFVNKGIITTPAGFIKIEPNVVIRGTLNNVQKRILSKEAFENLGIEVEAMCLEEKEVYAGKACAGLDRQHPRDLYDIHDYFKRKEKLDSYFEILFYLLQSNRPVSEMFDPNMKDISGEYESQLNNLMLRPLSLNDLKDARKKLVSLVQRDVFIQYYEFIISFVEGEPNYRLLEKNISEYPGIKWKQLNIRKMDKIKKQIEIEKLMNLKDKLKEI